MNTRGLVMWPDGIRLLVGRYPNLFSELQDSENLLHEACFRGKTESASILLDAGYGLKRPSWDFACSSKQMDTYELIAKGLAERYLEAYNLLFFQKEPSSASSDAILQRAITIGFYRDREHLRNDLGALFHRRSMTIEAARCLLDVGIRPHNIPISFYSDPPITALGKQLIRYYESASLLEWLMYETGFDLGDRVHGYILGNILGLQMGKTFIRVKLRWPCVETFSNALVISTLAEQRADDCDCLCSSNGCQTIISFLNGVSIHSRRTQQPLDPDLLILMLEWLDTEGNSSGLLNAANRIVAMLRVATFNYLCLTHTCCCMNVEFDTRFCKPSTKDIEDIQYSEAQDLDLLKTLLTEFEEQWDSYNGGFSEFVLECWKPRMEEVMRLRSEIDHEEYMANLKAVGVFFGPEKPPAVDEDFDEDFENWCRVNLIEDKVDEGTGNKVIEEWED